MTFEKLEEANCLAAQIAELKDRLKDLNFYLSNCYDNKGRSHEAEICVQNHQLPNIKAKIRVVEIELTTLRYKFENL